MKIEFDQSGEIISFPEQRHKGDSGYGQSLSDVCFCLQAGNDGNVYSMTNDKAVESLESLQRDLKAAREKSGKDQRIGVKLVECGNNECMTNSEEAMRPRR